jgi:hypothetical protein
MYPFVATAALRRAYDCLVFDGSEQGSSLYEKRLHFRPDYEVVLRAVVDFAVDRAKVDPHRIVLVGRSLGGYLAPRAATGEHCFAALIADPGLYDVGELVLSRILKPMIRGLENTGSDDSKRSWRGMIEERTIDGVFAGMLKNPADEHSWAREWLRTTRGRCESTCRRSESLPLQRWSKALTRTRPLTG